MRKDNVYSGIPDYFPDEIMETLVISGKVRIERIISDSHRSPDEFWYDQVESEFMLLLEGSAGLRFEGEDEIRVLQRGDWINIQAHLRHRVEWTDPEQKTVWLAVFYS